jgi:hypothetical protein
MSDQLLTPAQLRQVVTTALDDADLAAVIADEEAELVRRLGPHGDGATSLTLTVRGGGRTLFLPRIPVVVEEVSEGGAAVSSWGVLPGGELVRASGDWAALVTVTLIPEDDRPARRRALIELVRIALEQTAFIEESVASEHRYRAPESWEARRAAQYRRLAPMAL